MSDFKPFPLRAELKEELRTKGTLWGKDPHYIHKMLKSGIWTWDDLDGIEIVVMRIVHPYTIDNVENFDRIMELTCMRRKYGIPDINTPSTRNQYPKKTGGNSGGTDGDNSDDDEWDDFYD